MTTRNSNLPDVEFINTDAQAIFNDTLEKFEKVAGRKLYPADPYYSLVSWAANIFLELRVAFNSAAKQNLPRYAIEDKLDSLAELFHNVSRLPGAGASCMMQINLSEAAPEPVTVPIGTEFAVEGFNFATDDAVIFEPGETSKTIGVTCTTPGAAANGYAPGQIITIVKPFMYYDSCRNTTATAGGTDPEADNALYERMVQSEESYSVAGPGGAYEYHTKTVSPDIIDVKVLSPTPGYIKIYPLCTGGAIPGEALINKITETLKDENVRPLTDNVEVLKPGTISYDINFTYYISSADAMQEAVIKAAVAAATENYKLWQRSKLGRDVDVSQLIYILRAAGAKHITATAPGYMAVDSNNIATCNAVNIIYGGLEDE